MPPTKTSSGHDELFVRWLQRVGDYKYSGVTVLAHYMRRLQSPGWEEMIGHLRNNKADWWVFVRHKLGKEHVRAARDRYVDRFIFICKEEPSSPYIDALLEVDERQYQMRIGGTAETIICPGCKKREVLVLSLTERLRRLDEDVTIDARLELLRAEFKRLYVLDESHCTPSRIVREDMEMYLQKELKDEDALLASSELWMLFLREVVANAQSGGRINCRKRQTTLASALSLTTLSWCDDDRGSSGSKKRAR